MIAETLQDQAACYVLGLLDGEEAAAFELVLGENAELRELVKTLREAAADHGLSAPVARPPAFLKDRILREIAVEKQSALSPAPRRTETAWIPWAIAALFLIFCGLLAVDRMRLQRELASARAADALAQISFFTLAPSGPAPAAATGIVAWQPASQSGVIQISHLPVPAPGKDYQLWAVDAGHKDPVDAGIVHVDQNGIGQVRFHPVDAARQVKAFAVSLERKGGVPKAEGPIILVGAG